ncbi:MAG: hypothetical protein ACE5HS_23480 [bacterium]
MSTQTKPLGLWAALILVLALHTQPAVAKDVEIQIPSGISTQVFKDFSEEIGLAISYLPMAPAEPLGILGWDIGVEVTVIDIDQGLWSTAATADPPGTVLFPKLHLQKGLLFGIDLGASYTKVPQSNIEVIGGELKYAVVSGNVALPAIAIRGSYTQLRGVDNFDLETYGADISISKGFAFITPYAGYGQVWIKSKETAVLNIDETLNTSKPFVGVKVSLALINFVFEADFGELPMYTARFNVGF